MMSSNSPPLLQSKDLENEDDDMFASAIGTSGYATDLYSSDTLDDIAKTSEISLDDDDADEEDDDDNDLFSPSSLPRNKITSEDVEVNHLNGSHCKSSILGDKCTNNLERIFEEGNSEVGDFKNIDYNNTSKEILKISVTSPHKVGEGMNSYMTYNIKTSTNMNQFSKSEITVSRRFSDFLGLHDKLSEKYLPNGRIIPPAPDKSMLGMAKVKLGMENEVSSQDEFVERRRAALERYLNRTASHPSLRTDPDFRNFLEVESELPKANQTAALSGKNVMKMISKVGNKVSNLTLKMEETDEWFIEKNRMIDSLDSHLRKLWISVDALVDLRRSLYIATNVTSKSLASLSSVEDNDGLASTISKLSNVYDKMEGIHRQQCEADFYDLSELIKDYIGLIGAVKDSFNERSKAWINWQSLTAFLTKKREAKVRADLAMKADKISSLRQEIAELERQQEMAQENFEKISRLIKKEVEFFEKSKAMDFKTVILRYLEKMLKAQIDAASHWEAYLPEINNIAI